MNTALNRHEADLLKEGARLISFVWPAQNKELLEKLVRRKGDGARDGRRPAHLPRAELDALSAMANIAGYARSSSPPRSTAGFSGSDHGRRKHPPRDGSRARSGGCGARGRRLREVARRDRQGVRTREAVREQVESLGGQFIKFEFDEKGRARGATRSR